MIPPPPLHTSPKPHLPNILFTLLALLRPSTLSSSAAAPITPPADHHVALTLSSLGDSYASGLGAGTRINWACSRYADSYPSLLNASLSSLLRSSGAYKNPTGPAGARRIPIPNLIQQQQRPLSLPNLHPHDASSSDDSITNSRDNGSPRSRNGVVEFTYLACSGATTSDILTSQIPLLNDNSTDILTISAGGNDVGLSNILDKCVYQFYPSSLLQSRELNPDGDVTANRNPDASHAMQECQTSIHQAWKNINETLPRNLETLYRAMIPKLRSTSRSPSPSNENGDQRETPERGGIVYITPYTPFFSTSDPACDNTTFSLWSTYLSANETIYLSTPLRTQLNALVAAVNHQIFQTTLSLDANIFKLVPWAADIEALGGRYCEAGIHEPDPDRQELAFYEWRTTDPGENATALRTGKGEDVPRGSFEADIARRVGQALRERPEWRVPGLENEIRKSNSNSNRIVNKKGNTIATGNRNANKADERKADPSLGSGSIVEAEPDDGMGIEGGVPGTVTWLLPDSWKRVFHPRPNAHRIIAAKILDDIIDRLEKSSRWEGSR